MVVNAFARVPKPRYLSGKKMGVHAGYDEGGELVYIGMNNMKMHRHVLDELNREFEEEFGEWTTS